MSPVYVSPWRELLGTDARNFCLISVLGCPSFSANMKSRSSPLLHPTRQKSLQQIALGLKTHHTYETANNPCTFSRRETQFQRNVLLLFRRGTRHQCYQARNSLKEKGQDVTKPACAPEVLFKGFLGGREVNLLLT
jgi:hypothetical protein